MNSGLTEFVEEIQTKCRRPPQVESSKTQIHAKFHKILTIRFEDQKLTSFSGLLIFQVLFSRLNLKKRLKKFRLAYIILKRFKPVPCIKSLGKLTISNCPYLRISLFIK